MAKEIQLPIIKCDNAASIADTMLDEENIYIPTNSEYKFLTAMPIFEDGHYCAMCSKDLKKWSICIGAIVDGKPINLLEFAEQIKEEVEHGKQKMDRR